MRAEPSGTWFRGALQTGRSAWLAVDEGRKAVGYIDCGTFDRWVTYGGEGPNGPIILDTIARPAAALALVVQPDRRREGFGRAMLRRLVNHPDLASIEIFGAGVDPRNLASIRCLEAAGFERENEEPDFEGMLYYVFRRREGKDDWKRGNSQPRVSVR